VTDQAPDATVVIVTKDRREQLRAAITSALEQEGHVEVLVVDDGSSDGTADMVRADFPAARVERFTESAGLVVRRNDAARLARAPVIVSIDDDAVLTTPRIVAQTLADFDDPRIGVIAMPFVDVEYGPAEHQRAPDRSQRWVTATFRGTAHAVRRDLFLALGGYRAAIVHQGEENDFALRMLAAGHLVGLGTADPVHHLESPTRSLTRMAVYGRRNELLLAFTYLVLPWNVLFGARWALIGLRVGIRRHLLRDTFRGYAAGVRACWALRTERAPLPRSVLALDRRLRRERAVRLADLR
jgi:glycosyltransferase involved in cell wall biosynthesis